MTEWKRTTLGDVITLQRGFDLTQKEATPGLYPVISSGGPGYTSDVPKVDGPGVVTGRKGVLGKVFYTASAYWPHDTTLWVKDFKGSVPRFIYYLLQTLPLASLDAGAANPTLNRNHAHLLPVAVPDHAVQGKIADILGGMDNLIENNRGRVAALEEMARTIYHEWFVRFRFPGHEDAELVDSDLGPIPAGWEVATVADLSSTVSRGIAPRYAEDGAWTVLNQKCIRDERVSLGPSRRQSKEVPEPKLVRSGDVLINSTGVGTLGRVAMYRGHADRLTIDSHVTIARPNDPQLNPWFGMSLVAMKPAFEQLGSGSTGQTELSRTDVGAQLLAVPPPDLRARFAGAICPLLSHADALVANSEPLVAMRDVLLPKLVTGQIDVSSLEFDALVEGAVA